MLNVTNLQAFQKSIRNFAEKTRQAPVRVAKKLILDLHRETVTLTPVDTGRLVGAWQVSVTDDRPLFASNPYNDGVDRKSQEYQVKREHIDRVRTQSYGNSRIFWLANNVDYARHQEYGSSRNRGKFMLQTALTKIQAKADQLAKEAMSE